MLNFWQILQSRHCTREFDPTKKVPKEMIEKLIEAGEMAPSAGGLKSQKFFVIEDREEKEKIARAAFEQDFIADAGVVIVVCSDVTCVEEKYGKRGREVYAIEDAAAAGENIMLAATALGLGVCWVGAFDEEEIRGILGLPSHIRPLIIFPIGYTYI